MIAFFDEDGDNHCRLQIVTQNAVLLLVVFFARDRIKVYSDGSVLYRCRFTKLDGSEKPMPTGSWRERDDTLELRLFHHTNAEGRAGIESSKEIWGSRRNIQGNRWLENIAYGYFTSVPTIRAEEDLIAIAMSSSGKTGLMPTNTPYEVKYATLVPIPPQTAAQRSHALTFWVDCSLLAPNHLWMHQPTGKPAYYEIVLPKVFRVGLQVGKSILVDGNEVQVPPADRKEFSYVIVGDADSQEGLEAPYNEEKTTKVARIESIGLNDDIIAFWKRNGNTDQFSGRIIEQAELAIEQAQG